ncbi:MAG TPA: tetratricopeptide repeat protein [Gemmatimonadales bacterium]|jgi:tetratricopeptide (TPR) repeat protein
MRLTSSFAVFRADPQEQDLAKARWLAREGRLDAAEQEYRGVLELHPSIGTGWIELCELLRRQGRLEDALESANRAAVHFGPDAAMPLALKGAALSELGRTRESVAALEAALERDGNMALAWHELAYAAYRVGEYPRALLALDRAFALEPHTDTLMLRGRILREAGQYEAAEVAFEAALQASDHDIPKRDAERESDATRRAASLGGRKPRQFTPRERAYVQTGSVILEPSAVNAEQLADSLGRSIAALAPLVRRAGWKPAVVAGASRSDAPLAEAIARLLNTHPALAAAIDPSDSPLVVTTFNGRGDDWAKQVARLSRWKTGNTFALAQSPSADHAADIVGRLGVLDPELVARAAARALEKDYPEPDVTEAAALLLSPESPWRSRLPE